MDQSGLKFSSKTHLKREGIDMAAPLVSKDGKRIVVVVKREELTTKKALELLLSGTLPMKVCRYCLHITNSLSDLDQIMQIGGKEAIYKVTIRDIVASFHPIQVIDDPNIPNKICEKCLNRAIQSYKFTQQCEQAERALRNCFDDMYEKCEKLDPLERTKKRGRQKSNPNYNILHTENKNVIDYAEPIRNLVNIGSVLLTKSTQMGELECKRCWQVLPNIESLVNHEKVHPKTMWYHCRICGKSFAKKNHITKHLRQHAKAKVDENESDFVCRQCGYHCDDYNVHLQHIEKHKFQVMFQHLIEKKMDKLCSVCLDRKGRMVGLDKIICLHGGYPELTGDRTIYNILGSTVPEVNYKYQELYIANKPTIMTITKKVDNISFKQLTFILSSPVIISLERLNCNETYIFKFSKPKEEIIDSNEDTKKNHLNNQHDMEIEPKESSENTDTIFKEILANTVCNIDKTDELNENQSADESDDTIIKINSEKQIFTSSKPIYDIKNIGKEKSDLKLSNNKLCKICWVFKKPVCKECTNIELCNEKIVTENNSTTTYLGCSSKVINKQANTCQFCWIFKSAGQCHCCRENTKDLVKIVESTFTTKEDTIQIISDKIKDETLAANKAKKRKTEGEPKIAAKKTKWQCSFCLTTNNTDRDTCLCCESNETYVDAVKLNFHSKYNLGFLEPDTKTDKQINSNKKVTETNFEVKLSTDEANNEHLKGLNLIMTSEIQATKIKSDNPVTLNASVKMMSPIKPISEFTASVSNQEDTMDVVTEDYSLHQPLAAMLTTSYPNPYSFAFTSPLHQNFNPMVPELPNKLQFNIGSISFEDRSRKKFKRSYKRVPSLK